MRQSLHRHSPYGELLQTQVLSSDEETGEVEITYEAGPQFLNRIGTVAGGMIAAVLDSVTGHAALAALPPGQVAVHVRLEVEYLRAVRPGRLRARARVVAREGRDLHTRGELEDETGEVAARGDATLRILARETTP